jgi:hypothetical protein
MPAWLFRLVKTFFEEFLFLAFSSVDILCGWLACAMSSFCTITPINVGSLACLFYQIRDYQTLEFCLVY